MMREKSRYTNVYIACGLTGLLLGGPISGTLSSLCIYAKLKGAGGTDRTDTNNKRADLFMALLGWAAIGSIAMPISWFVANNIGWNFDAVALVQSSGQYKSYRDWSGAEERKKKAERDLRRLKYEERRTIERVKYEQERREDAERQQVEEARAQEEEAQRQIRADSEMREYNKPENVAERNRRHMEHLQSVGCIDFNGQVVRNIFCLNTEAPPEN
jgi:hypothetical protein